MRTGHYTRLKGRTTYFRRKIPDFLQEQLASTEICYRLGVISSSVAERLGRRLAVEVDTFFDQAKTNAMLTSDDLTKLVQAALSGWREDDASEAAREIQAYGRPLLDPREKAEAWAKFAKGVIETVSEGDSVYTPDYVSTIAELAGVDLGSEPTTFDVGGRALSLGLAAHYLQSAVVTASLNGLAMGSRRLAVEDWQTRLFALEAHLGLDRAAQTQPRDRQGQPQPAADKIPTPPDANGVVASAAYMLAITQSAAVTLSPPAGVLPQAMTGEGYEQTITATGAIGAVTYAISAGALPSGLALKGATGLISGTVTGGATTTSFSVSVTDSQGNTGVAHYQLQVLAREVTSPVIEVSVPAGSTPIPVNLTAGATGGPFTSGFVESVMPLEAGTARITGADVAAINTNYAALYLRFTPNPQFTGRAVVTYRLLNNQGAWAQGTVSYTLSADLSAVARQVQTLSDGFVATRGGLLAGAVDTPGLLSRRAAGRAQMPVAISVTPSGNSVSMNFAASTLATNAASTAVESLINAPVDNGGLNFWIDGNATLHVRNDSVGNHWGSLGVVSVGGDALVTKDLLVGVALHIDWMDDVTNASRVWGTGLLIGPYMSAELVDGVFLDASAYYGQSWNSIFTGPFNGTFETQRFLAKAALSGQWALGDNLTLEPAANLFYLREAASAYTGSDGQGNSAGIASFALDQLRASVGTTLRYRMDLDGELAIVPFLGVELGLSLTNGIGGQFGSVSTGFDITGLGAWTPGLGVKTGLEDGALRSVSATGRAQANF